MILTEFENKFRKGNNVEIAYGMSRNVISPNLFYLGCVTVIEQVWVLNCQFLKWKT
jgi:hypothetical protein